MRHQHDIHPTKTIGIFWDKGRITEGTQFYFYLLVNLNKSKFVEGFTWTVFKLSIIQESYYDAMKSSLK